VNEKRREWKMKLNADDESKREVKKPTLYRTVELQ